MPSALRSMSRRASQFLRGDRSDEERPTTNLGDVASTIQQINGGGCLPSLIPMRKRTKKAVPPTKFMIAADSPSRDPPPQLPVLSELGNKKVRKASSIAVIPRQALASQELAPAVIEAFRPRPSSDLRRTKLNMPGAFPSSSSPVTDRESSNFRVSPLPSPLKLWLTSEKQLNQSTDTVVRVTVDALDRSSSFSKINESSETVVRRRPDSQPSTSGLLENVVGMPRAESIASTWATTTEPDTEPGTPLVRQPTPQIKNKANDRNHPYPCQSQQLGIDPSASITSSIRQLPPHRHLRHQPKLPSERRWASLDEESYNSQMERPEQSALRRKFHLPSATSRSKLQWGDLESNVSSLNSTGARNLRKDLKLPSRRVSAPNLSGLRRTQEYVEALSGQPDENSYEPFFDSSEIRNEVFGDQGHAEQVFQDRKFTDETYHSNEQEANNAFFGHDQTNYVPLQHKAIINNLYTAVQRVDTEMARVQLENHQLAQSEEEANNRAAFWEERAGGLKETLRQKEREREELVELMLERDIPIPQALLRKWEMEREERELETVQEADEANGEAEQDTGYDADVSAETEELYEAAAKMQ